MARYKPDQGAYARSTSRLLLGALTVFGCYTLYYFLLSFRGSAEQPGFLVTDLSSGALPVLGVPLTPALLVATAVGAALLLVLVRLLERPRIADTLIEAETEMRKCTWPSWDETFKLSIVILVVMVFFTVMLAGMDWMLNAVTMEYVF